MTKVIRKKNRKNQLWHFISIFVSLSPSSLNLCLFILSISAKFFIFVIKKISLNEHKKEIIKEKIITLIFFCCYLSIFMILFF